MTMPHGFLMTTGFADSSQAASAIASHGPTPTDFGIWILVALALAPGLERIVSWARGGKQRREVSFEATYATTEQLDGVRTEIDGRIDRVETDLKTLEKSIVTNGEARRQAIEAKVEGARIEAREMGEKLTGEFFHLGREVTGLKSALESVHSSLGTTQLKLDRLIERSAKGRTES